MSFEFKLPDIGEGVVEGEIIRWLVSEGDAVVEDQPMVEVMTDKATVEIPSPVKGIVSRTVGAEGDIVEVGAVLVVIENGSEAGAPPSQAPAAVSRTETAESAAVRGPRPAAAKVLATPAVRKYARERGVDLTQVKATGPRGRMTKEDVDRTLIPATPIREKAAPPSEPGQDRVETVPYRGLRRKVGDHMVAAKRFAPHYTYVEEVDVTVLVDLRKQFGQLYPDRRLTYLPFLLKAVTLGLKKYPLLNATLDEDAQVIQLKKYYNIGVAMATPDGLIVPIVRDVDAKSVSELAEELRELGEQTKKGEVKREQLQNGTFTITSLGFLGGVLATPIINYPEVGIMGVHKIAPRPVVRDGAIVVREMMNLSLSLDHRVVDGVIGAEFMRHIIPYLENPGLLLVD